jgi:hypothetical protein
MRFTALFSSLTLETCGGEALRRRGKALET